MEVKVRGLQASVVKSIDEKASKQGLSRNEYLKRAIERMATIDVFYEERNEYVSLVKSMESIIRHNTDEISRYKDSMERIEKYFIDLEGK